MNLKNVFSLSPSPFKVPLSSSSALPLLAIIATCLIISLQIGGSSGATGKNKDKSPVEKTTDCPDGSCSAAAPGNNDPEEEGGCQMDTSLLLVQVIFRHGDRTPLYFFPRDTCKSSSNSNLTRTLKRKGLLTKRGKVQAYELGSYLGARYKYYLKDAWIPEDIHVQSSSVERSMMTAETVLAGMFPPGCSKSENDPTCEGKWSREILWQPIPVYTIPRKHDNKINFQWESCPAYVNELNNVLSCRQMAEFSKRYQHVYEIVRKNTGLRTVNIQNIGSVYDTLLVQSLYGLPLLDWTQQVFPEPMKTIHQLGFQVLSANRKMMRLNGGPLLKEVMENLREAKQRAMPTCPTLRRPKRKGRPKKLFLYSGHDTTVSAFLSALNVFDIHHPPYTAAIMIELHHKVLGEDEDDGDCDGGGSCPLNLHQFIVKVFYRNDTTDTDPHHANELTIPECGNPCYLDKLERVVRDLLLTKAEWERECHNQGWLAWFFSPLTSFMSRFSKGSDMDSHSHGGGSGAVCGCK